MTKRGLKISIFDFDGREYELTTELTKEQIESGFATVVLKSYIESMRRHALSLPLCDSWKNQTTADL